MEIAYDSVTHQQLRSITSYQGTEAVHGEWIQMNDYKTSAQSYLNSNTGLYLSDGENIGITMKMILPTFNINFPIRVTLLASNYNDFDQYDNTAIDLIIPDDRQLFADNYD